MWEPRSRAPCGWAMPTTASRFSTPPKTSLAGPRPAAAMWCPAMAAVGSPSRGAGRFNQCQATLIGIHRLGTASLSITFAGVTSPAPAANVVGGTSDAESNVISRQRPDGIYLSTNSVATRGGELIGTSISGKRGGSPTAITASPPRRPCEPDWRDGARRRQRHFRQRFLRGVSGLRLV